MYNDSIQRTIQEVDFAPDEIKTCKFVSEHNLVKTYLICRSLAGFYLIFMD